MFYSFQAPKSEHKMLLLLKCLTWFISHTFALCATSMENAKSSICKEGHIISAISRVSNKKGMAYIFTGPYVWTYNIQQKTLETVDLIQDKFQDSRITFIKAGDYRTKFLFYELFYDQYLYHVNTSSVTAYNLKEFYRRLQARFHAGVQHLPIKNMASFCTTPGNCILLFQQENSQIYECEYKNGEDRLHCKNKVSMSLVNGVDLDKQFEGIMIDADLEEDAEKRHVLIADTEKLHYWYNGALVYTLYNSQLFECGTWVFFIILITLCCILVVIVLGIATGYAITYKNTRHFRTSLDSVNSRRQKSTKGSSK